MEFTAIAGPAHWASYLINGDASGLEEGELAKVEAWLEREGILGIQDVDSDSERFTWHYRMYAPECGYDGGTVVDYICTMKGK